MRDNDCRVIAKIELEVIAGEQVQVAASNSCNSRTEAGRHIEFRNRSARYVWAGDDDAFEGHVRAIISQVRLGLDAKLLDNFCDCRGTTDQNN